MFDRRLVQNFDWSLLSLALILGFLGLVTLYSAVTAGTQAPQMEYYKQLVWYFVGLIFLVLLFDPPPSFQDFYDILPGHLPS
ncbi:MAG: hypothetical protein KKC23_08210, partial [Proteobacteria bacterium]|nr:hypothetical protein [Pseudomonadota bacterium]